MGEGGRLQFIGGYLCREHSIKQSYDYIPMTIAYTMRMNIYKHIFIK